MKKKESYVLIIFGFILIGVIVAMAFYIFSPTSSAKPEQPSISVVPTQSVAMPTTTADTVPLVSYDNASQDRLLDKFTNRVTLSSSDSSIKTKILALLPAEEQSGILYKSKNVIIDYAAAPDDIAGEILTTNIQTAKTEAVSWLRSQGMSQKGICDLPFSFYLNNDVAEELRNSEAVFNPLPDGC